MTSCCRLVLLFSLLWVRASVFHVSFIVFVIRLLGQSLFRSVAVAIADWVIDWIDWSSYTSSAGRVLPDQRQVLYKIPVKIPACILYSELNKSGALPALEVYENQSHDLAASSAVLTLAVAIA